MSTVRPIYDCVDLKELRLVSCSARMDPNLPDHLQEGTMRLAGMKLNTKSRNVLNRADSDPTAGMGYVLAFHTSFSVKGDVEDDAAPDDTAGSDQERPEALDVSADYVVMYWCRRPEPPTDDELDLLADGTAVFNTWPFFREYLHSMFFRMSLSLPLLPSMSPNLNKYMGSGRDENTAEDSR